MSSLRLAHLLAPVLVTIVAHPAGAQSQLKMLKGTPKGACLGWVTLSLDDVDGDGALEFAVSEPGHLPLANGVGRVRLYDGATQTPLWTAVGSVVEGDYGYAVADVGDVDGDLVRDLIVGAPDIVPGAGHAPVGTAGRFEVLSGATGAVHQELAGSTAGDMLGYAVAGLGDVNGDGAGDYAVGAPGDDDGGPSTGSVRVLSGADLSLLYEVDGAQPDAEFGTTLAAIADNDGDGVTDLLVGVPNHDIGGPDTGRVILLSGASGAVLYSWDGPEPNAHFGSALADLGDVDGDGVHDIAVGAHDADAAGVGISAGAVFVYSGLTKSLIFERLGDSPSNYLGFSVAGIADVSGDGLRDVLVGGQRSDEMGYGAGRIHVLTGNTGAELGRAYGKEQEFLGSSITSLGDLTGDGLPEFAACGYLASGGQKGILRIYSTGLPMPPSSYCKGKENSQGCVPTLSSQGTATLSGPDDFVLEATDVINNKAGLLIWSLGADSTPIFNATLCLASPIQRTPVSLSGGNAGGDDCSGKISFHFTQAYMNQKGLVAGSLVHAQVWYRDPALQYHKAGLSQALAFFVTP